MSFRGFVEELREQADGGQAAEAPILEEGSDGVRLMTVHKAKGLEFPVVILADMTAKLRERTRRSADRSRERNACYLRLGRWTPIELAAERGARGRARRGRRRARGLRRRDPRARSAGRAGGRRRDVGRRLDRPAERGDVSADGRDGAARRQRAICLPFKKDSVFGVPTTTRPRARRCAGLHQFAGAEAIPWCGGIRMR